jgi:hypothetical protein
MYADRTIENGRATKKNAKVRLTNSNHADLFRLLFTRAEDIILAFLAHPGDQKLLLGKLAVKPFDFTAAGHADMLPHPGDPVRENQISRSWLDAGRIWNRELVAHAFTSERKLCDSFFDILDPASQIRLSIRILAVSILTVMASFSLWIALAMGKYLKDLCCQPQDVAVIRFDFKFHILSFSFPLLRKFTRTSVI